MLLSSLATAKPVTYTRTKYHVDFKAAVVVNDVASSIGRPGEIGLPVPTGSIWSCFIGNLNLSQDGVYRNIICNANGTK
ncbi:MAG TPA: hypothetical protein VHD33_01935, partial [Legionellaceae bacterium]|nr:hypothetical protein [Legionellaceae bacterium]